MPGATRTRAVCGSGTFVEGWAVYVEELLATKGFGGTAYALHQWKRQLRMVVDAAVDQLATWAERGGATIVRPQHEGQDPASVAFQTIDYAKQTGTEIVLVDTAGRLHTKGGLMDELTKIRRVIEKQAPISEVLLVLDATTGQNGVMQAEAFLEHAGVTGLVITKLDGSAKGGFVLAVQERTGIPVKLLGQGEGIGDLTGFTPHVFVEQLVG